MPDSALLSSRAWKFEGGQGVLSPDLWLVPGGIVGGHVSRLEHRWQYQDGKITFFNREGAPSSILTRQPDSNGGLIFSGPVLGDRTGTNTRTLTREPPRVGCFLRTHFWAPTVARAYERLAAAWGGPVLLSSDQTNRFTVPEGIGEVPHSAGEFIRLGLPCHPLAKRMLWYNGDYVFYSLALNTDFDFFIVCEYDLAFNALDLRAVIDRMIADGMDAVGSGLGKRSRGWGWHAPQTKWVQAEIAHAKSAEDFQQVYGVFFPFVMMSRQAALHLYSRRLEMARLWRSGQVTEEWPFCESFTATELHRGGFKVANLTEYVPADRLHMTVDNVQSWQEVERASALMLHPVLDGARFAKKVHVHGHTAARAADLSEVDWMRQQLSRDMSDEDRAALTSEIELAAAAPPNPAAGRHAAGRQGAGREAGGRLGRERRQRA
jgi:hypothetical protein